MRAFCYFAASLLALVATGCVSGGSSGPDITSGKTPKKWRTAQVASRSFGGNTVEPLICDDSKKRAWRADGEEVEWPEGITPNAEGGLMLRVRLSREEPWPENPGFLFVEPGTDTVVMPDLYEKCKPAADAKGVIASWIISGVKIPDVSTGIIEAKFGLTDVLFAKGTVFAVKGGVAQGQGAPTFGPPANVRMAAGTFVVKADAGYDPGAEQARVVATIDGKKVPNESTLTEGDGKGATHYVFKGDPTKVTELEIQKRPFIWVPFKSLKLTPGQSEAQSATEGE